MILTQTAGCKVDHGQSAKLCRLLEQVQRHSKLLGIAVELCGAEGASHVDLPPYGACMTHGLHHIACMRSGADNIYVNGMLISVATTDTVPVPASPLVRIMAAPSAILRRASPRLRAPHTKGTLKPCLSTWFSSSAGVRTDKQRRDK